MKRNYTLKVTLAMLFVVLVSLVSFVGVYKGKNLIKDYTLGKDFKDRKVAFFSVKEDTSNTKNQNENNENAENTENTENNENAENTENQNVTPEENTNEINKEKEYNNAKNIIEKRLAEIKAQDYNIRLNEENGSLVLEVPTNMDTSNLVELLSKGKAQIVNQSSNNDVIVDSNGFKSASAKIDTKNYSKPVIVLDIEFSKDAKNAFKNANTKYTDSDGNEKDATFAFTLDGQSLYSDTAEKFVETAKNGTLSLSLGQASEKKKLEDNFTSAQILVALIKYGEIPIEYQADSVEIVSSNINIKTIIIVASIVGCIMLIFAVMKFKKKAILPIISIIGLVASMLLVLRYTNVEITLFTILGVTIITIADYVLILKALGSNKNFKQDVIEELNILIPCMISAIVFCCAPYLQLATLGMSIFWGIIVMFIYNIVITKVLIDK